MEQFVTPAPAPTVDWQRVAREAAVALFADPGFTDTVERACDLTEALVAEMRKRPAFGGTP